MKYADLHLHTKFSDATYSVEELISVAAEKGLSCIAITDHDSVDGLIYLRDNIPNPSIEVIPGIELSCDIDSYEAHILGYFVDIDNYEFRIKLEEIKDARRKRICDMTDKLKDLGIVIDPQEVFDLSGNGTVGRLHLARVMHKNGFISNTTEAFYKYIGDNCPAYVSQFRLTPEEAIKLLLKVGAVPILAHPYSLRNQELIYSLLDSGLRGLEVYYPEHTQGMQEHYLNFTKKYNLLISGGSDCHGNAKIRSSIGSVKIPYELVEKIRNSR